MEMSKLQRPTQSQVAMCSEEKKNKKQKTTGCHIYKLKQNKPAECHMCAEVTGTICSLQVLGPPYQQTGIPPISPSPSADEHQL